MQRLVEAFEHPAFELASLLLGNATTAEEIVQEAFVRAWLSPHTPREPLEFRPWLFRIVVNLVRDHRRSKERWARLRLPLRRDPNVENEAETLITLEAVGSALRQLSDRERVVLVLRLLRDWSYGEIANVLGVGEGAARVLNQRALRRLRKLLHDQGFFKEVEGN